MIEEQKNMVISSRKVLGERGRSFSLSYGTVTFTDNGYLEIYGNLTLQIGALVNFKESDTLVPCEFKVIGDAGENGSDSIHGEDGGTGGDGVPTRVTIEIGKLSNSIKIVSIGGGGGNGGHGLNGLDGGSGGNAAISNIKSKQYPLGGQGGDASNGSGNGGCGGNGGKGPSIIVRYAVKMPGAEISTDCLRAEGGEGGKGGKGGKGGAGGKNGDNKTYANNGKNGTSCDDGKPGSKGEPGTVDIQSINTTEG